MLFRSVDVHHFDLIRKLNESGLSPESYEGGEYRGTDNLGFSVHNYEDRSSQEVITTERMFLGHFPYTPRNHREEVGPEADAILGNFEERVKNYTEEEINLTGLYYKSQKTGKFIDRFNSRIIFPVNSISGDTIAFGGRVIRDGKLAKYIN